MNSTGRCGREPQPRWTGSRLIHAAHVVVFMLSVLPAETQSIWSAPELLSTDDIGEFTSIEYPRIAMDASGTAIAVWKAFRQPEGVEDAFLDIVGARRDSSTGEWSTPFTLSQDPSGRILGLAADIETNDRGTWIAAWLAPTSVLKYEILVSRTEDEGRTWSQPASLNPPAEDTFRECDRPQIATDGQGNWIVVWATIDGLRPSLGSEIHYARSSDEGLTWTAPRPLEGGQDINGLLDFDPSVASDHEGHYVVVWTSGEGSFEEYPPSDKDILVSRSMDDGETWSTPTLLDRRADSDIADDEYPEIATDCGKVWVAIWSSSERLDGGEYERAILCARSTDFGATWSTPVTLSLSAVRRPSPVDPTVATDGQGNWIATWGAAVRDPMSGMYEYDAYTAISTDDALTWTMGQPMSPDAATDTRQDYAAQLASDGNGRWIAVWNTFPRETSQVYASTLDADFPQQCDLCDRTPPVAVGGTAVLALDRSGTAVVTGDMVDGGSSDDCEIVTRTVAPDTFSCDDLGDHEVMLTVTDGNGNSDTTTATVTVVDTRAPDMVCTDLTVSLDGNGQASVTPGELGGDTTDNCGVESLRISQDTFACADIGENLVTVTGRDVNGNFTTCVARVTVLDPGDLCVVVGEGEGEGEGEDTRTLAEWATALLAAFEGADANVDGRLSFEEAMTAETGLGREMFDALDGDGDGLLSQAELEAHAGTDPVDGVGCLENAAMRFRDFLGDLFLATLAMGVLLTTRRMF